VNGFQPQELANKISDARKGSILLILLEASSIFLFSPLVRLGYSVHIIEGKERSLRLLWR
jgi:hypothetical protein